MTNCAVQTTTVTPSVTPSPMPAQETTSSPTATSDVTPSPFPTLDFIPDGRIIFEEGAYGSPHGSIGLINGDGSGRIEINTPGIFPSFPTWSPDGQRIAFGCETRMEDGYTFELCILNLRYLDKNDGVSLPEYLQIMPFPPGCVGNMEPSLTSISWAPDGNQLALTCYFHYVCLVDIHQNQMNCGAASSLLTGFSESDEQILDHILSIDWSPTDRDKWVIESGGRLYLVDLARRKLRALDNGELVNRSSPVWSRDGVRIAFLNSPIIINDGTSITLRGNVGIAVINSGGTGMKIAFDEVADFQNLQPNPYFDYVCPICVGKGYYAHQLSVGGHIFYSNTALFSWSPDGRFIVFEARPTPWDDILPTGLFRLDLQTGHIVPILVEFPGRAFMSPDWSP